MKLNKSQLAVLAKVQDSGGAPRVPVDGHRACMAARKLQEMGLGRFKCESYWDRSGNKSIPTLVSCGYFYPGEA